MLEDAKEQPIDSPEALAKNPTMRGLLAPAPVEQPPVEQVDKQDTTVTTKPVEPVSERAQTLLRVIDGDTLHKDGQSHRIPYIDTEESVHTDTTRNTPKGQQTSQFMKDVIPETSDVSLDVKGQDKYGRNISQAKRIINGVEVDWGLVVMDQDLSHYVTSFGEAPDEWHDVYKQYYSKYAPYQYNEVAPVLPDEQLAKMQSKEQRFQTA